jgi:hypothetical protein
MAGFAWWFAGPHERPISVYEFAPPGHTRAASIRELFGWQPGETLARTPVSADGPFNSGVSLS